MPVQIPNTDRGFRVVSANRTLGVALVWLKIEAPTLIPAGTLVPEGRRVALLSRDVTPSQVDAYFDIKRELHRRFTPDQEPGNVFRWSWGGLELRTPVHEFVQEGLELARSTPSAGRDAVRAPAARRLGPMKNDTRAVSASAN